MRYSLGIESGKLELFAVELVNLYPTIDGGLRVPPKDLSPTPNFMEFERDGSPVGWFAPTAPFRPGWWPFVTMPGRRDQRVENGMPTVPPEQVRPPSDRFLYNQAFSPVELDEPWTATEAVIPGGQPLRVGHADLPRSMTPIAVVVDARGRGLKSAVYGVAYGFADRKKRCTPPSAFAFTNGAIAEGQGLKFIVPDVTGAQATYIYFAVTLPDRGKETARIVAFVDLRQVLYDTHSFPGPLMDKGKKPPEKNETGVGRLAPVAIGEHKPGSRSRPWAHIVNAQKGFGLQAGRWRIFWRVRPEGLGPSLLSKPSREFPVKGDIEIIRRVLREDEEKQADEEDDGTDSTGKKIVKKRKQLNEQRGKAFKLKPPPNLPNKSEFNWVIQIVPEVGAAAYYEVGATALGRDTWFKQGGRADEDGILIHGYPGDSAPGRPEYRLYSYEGIDESEPGADGTQIVAPDPASAMDAPYGYGLPGMTIGSYKTAISDALIGYPGEGPISPSTSERRVGSGETLRLRRRSLLTAIPNAEGTDVSAAGEPAEWTGANLTSPVVAAPPEDGVWRYTAASNQQNNAQGTGLWARYGPWHELDESTESVFNVVGTMEVVTDFVGGVEAVLQFGLEDNTSTTRDLVTNKAQPMRLSDVGLRTLLPRGVAWGPGTGRTIPEGAVRVRWIHRAVRTDGEWRQTALFKDWQIFPFRDALRKQAATHADADDADAGLRPHDPDDVSSAAPYPQQSGWTLGPAPRIIGAPPEDVRPLGVWDFAGAAVGAGGVPASLGNLTNEPNPGGHTPVIESDTTTPTGTGRRLALRDESTNSRAVRFYTKTYSDTQLGAKAVGMATRILYRVPRQNPSMPTRGEVGSVQILDHKGKPFGIVRFRADGVIRVYRQRLSDGALVDPRNVVGGAAPDSLIDVEIAVSGENSRNGQLRCSAGVNAPRRQSVVYGGQDYRGRKARMRRFGIVGESDAAARSGMWIYSVVDTPGGDVIDRENPAPAADLIPPNPDAPPATPGSPIENPSGFRLLDFLGRRLNQWGGIIEPRTRQGSGHGPSTRRPIVVLPGQVFTQAIQGRFELFGTPNRPTQQFFVVLTRDGGSDPLHVGSPFGAGKDAAAVGRTAGSRSTYTDENGVVVPKDGMDPREDWAAEDFWHAFTVPDWDVASGELPYTEAHVMPMDDAAGSYFFQEHLFSPGLLDTQLKRDAARDYGRLFEEGTVRAVVDTAVPGADLAPVSASAQAVVAFGADHGSPDAAPLAWTARSTDRSENEGWSRESSDPMAVPDGRAFQIYARLGRDEATGEYPEIPAGGIYVEKRPAVPVLLDANRRPLAGMILAGSTEAFQASEENEEPVDGHAFSVRQSDVVRRLDPMALLAMTVPGWRFLKELTANDVCVYADPYGGDDGTGRIYTIRFYSRLSVERRPFAVRVFGGIKRTHAVVSESPEAEVLEVAPMPPARGY